MTLPPLPAPDGCAEHNKEPHPDGGYTFDEVDAWSEALVRAYGEACAAAMRERCANAADDFLTKGRSPLGKRVAAALRATPMTD